MFALLSNVTETMLPTAGVADESLSAGNGVTGSVG
jgi:hypothetical protein